MILIVVEHAAGEPRRSALELVSVGRSLAQASGAPLAALVLAGAGTGGTGGALGAEAVAEHMASFVPDVHVVEHEVLEPPRAETMTRALAHAATTLGASVLLLPASRLGLSCGPRVALRLGGSLLEDVTSVAFEDGAVVATRPAFLARVSVTVVAEAEPVVVSVELGAPPRASPLGGAGGVHRLEVPFEARDERLQSLSRRALAKERVALDEAEVVVCGGRGLGSAEAFERHVLRLAERLGAGVGATRAVVDVGWRSYAEQIGQTGTTVAPRLFVALGVSGAVQHVSGMNRSGVIVAVNTDADAPIFRISDYCVVGDVNEVVPALDEALAGIG